MLLVLLAPACRDDESGGRADDDLGDSEGSEGSEGLTTWNESGDGADSDTGADTEAEPEESPVDEARRSLPTYLDLHDKVISRTCTPNEGVCHNDKEYPDLHTPLAMLGSLWMPCNLVVKDDIDTFDGCERRGDSVTFVGGLNDGVVVEIAWSDIDVEAGAVILTLRDAIPNAMEDPAVAEYVRFSRSYGDGETVLADLPSVAFYEGGTQQLVLYGVEVYGPEMLEVVGELRGGDPNRNGVYGAGVATFSMITPGDPASSYLLGRVQATVPGTPMPLANQPLSSAEMLALTCWIEGLAEPGAADVLALIDYDACDAALTFGQPDPNSGHSLSGDVQPILDTYCSAGGCHGGDVPAMDLDLSAGVSRANLLRYAAQDSSTPLVEPGNPTNSYLMIKLWSKGIAGLQMPRGPTGEGEPLPEEDIATIERWIVAGAPDD